ncbi:hypothetical protein ACSBR2_025415 [Camellia fascicularis]
MSCNVSLTESCPALQYYVPKIPKPLEETSSLFHVNSCSVNRTVDGFSIAVDCSCPAGHSEFTWHTDYTFQHGDTWESISEKFPPFVVEKPDKTLIESQTISLDRVCGCSKGDLKNLIDDKAHTKESAKALADTIQMTFPKAKLVLVVAMASDRPFGFCQRTTFRSKIAWKYTKYGQRIQEF